MQETSINRNIRLFSYKYLQDSTSNFTTLIGEGGFGSVYKGVLPNGKQVAIKKLHPGKRYYDDDGFLRVIEILSHIQHRNLNQILGVCVDDDHRILVTEYEDLGDPSHNLHKLRDWDLRSGLCLGIARGLLYLHEDVHQKIIHGDIKSANILLDKNFVPKLADFDLIEFHDHYDKVPPKPDLQLTGSVGYLDPEYMDTRVYTDKADVYSFGVLMLEIISGRNPLSFPEMYVGDKSGGSMLKWVSTLRESDRVKEIADPVLFVPSRFGEQFDDELMYFVDVAMLCCESISRRRPHMSQVVQMLSGRPKFSNSSMQNADYYSRRRSQVYSSTYASVGLPYRWAPKPPLHWTSPSKDPAETSTQSFQGATSFSNTMTNMSSTSSSSRVHFNAHFNTFDLKKPPRRNANTMVLQPYYAHTNSMEAVYPPLLTGVTRRRSGSTF